MVGPLELSKRTALVWAVLALFDFEKVHGYMVEINWCWATVEAIKNIRSCSGSTREWLCAEHTEIPSAKRIKASARQQCEHILKNNLQSSESGGLKAEINLLPTGVWMLTLTMRKKYKRDGLVEKAVASVPEIAVSN